MGAELAVGIGRRRSARRDCFGRRMSWLIAMSALVKATLIQFRAYLGFQFSHIVYFYND
ncbi:MAG: hypothetical protein ACYC9L_13635 [Sulfuricaulis sp.]